jgi:hypothetical protein
LGGAGFFGFLEGVSDGLVAVAEEVVVVGVREFVEGEVGHALGFEFEVLDVGELDRLGHFDGLAVGPEPVGAGVVAGSAAAIRRGGEVERDLFEVGDGEGGDAVDDVLELVVEELEGAVTFADEVLVDEDRPAPAVESSVTGRGWEIGVASGAQVGNEGVPIGDELITLRRAESLEEVRRGDGAVGLKTGF